MDELKKYFNITKRKKKRMLWNIINNFVKNDYPCNWQVFLEFRVRSYISEIKEIYIEECAIKKIKPYLIKYIDWRLWNPNNGIRYRKLVANWYNRF